MSERTKVILDVDTGVDDALAILLAAKHPQLELLAVTTVAGNVGLEHTTRNSLQVLELAGRADVPVAAGTHRPMLRVLRDAATFHGKNGLNDIELPKPKAAPVDKHAVDLLIELVHRYPCEITLVPLGPLTNIALAILKDPAFSTKLKKIVLMGGAAFCAGNHGPCAEFNIWVDSEAAKIVFDSGIPITMVGLDVTMRTGLVAAHVQEMVARQDNGITRFVHQLLAPYYQRASKLPWYKGFNMHDPLAVGVVIDPSLVRTELHRVDIETKGELTEGMTVVDCRQRIMHGADYRPNAHVAVDVDADRFLKLWMETLLA
jgi:purine nucleosidase